MSRPFAWGWTALSSFETCPKRYYHLSVAKDVTEAPSPELAWGRDAHKALEKRVSEGTALPQQFSMWEPWGAYVSGLKAKADKVLVEVQHCLNKDLQPTDWFGRDAWVRSISDVEIHRGKTLLVIDWKTGKVDENNEQLLLTTAIVFHTYPHIQQVSTAFIYLKSGDIRDGVYTRKDLPELWGRFLPRVREMEKARKTQTYAPKPSGLCIRHCPVVSCPYYGKGSR